MNPIELERESTSFFTTPIVVLCPRVLDAVLSCGGLLLQHEDALVLTLASGTRTGQMSTHSGDGERDAQIEVWRAENANAMLAMGCEHVSLPIAIATERTRGGNKMYSTPESIFGAVPRADTGVCDEIEEGAADWLAGRIVLCPMAIGAHVDHQLCAHAGRRFHGAGHVVWFFQDAPYCFPDPGSKVKGDSAMLASRRLQARIWTNRGVAIEAQAKVDLAARCSSQIRSLFGDVLNYSYLLEGYHESIGGELEFFHQLRW